MNKKQPIEILEKAISDCGYWRYWSRTDDALQIEFGGTQIYTPSSSPDQPPSSLVAVRLLYPEIVIVLTRSLYAMDVPNDWFNKLAKNAIEPFTLDYECFSLSDVSIAESCLENADTKDWIIGKESAWAGNKGQSIVAFWAQNVGLVAKAEGLQFFTMDGELTEDDIEHKHLQWWDYWREYWKRKNSEDPMPKDYACEVTIPTR